MWIILAYAVGVLTGGSAVWLIAYYLGMKAAWEEVTTPLRKRSGFSGNA